MALHDELRTLGQRLGTGVFEDSDSFRGALDDFLGEGDATTGEINLLVDTVRLGAYRRLSQMIDGGAEPAAAVASAGEMLARERGSADLNGSRWACAAIGFAADKVPVAEVQKYYTGTAPAPGGVGEVGQTAAPPLSSPPHMPPQGTPPMTSPAGPYVAGLPDQSSPTAPETAHVFGQPVPQASPRGPTGPTGPGAGGAGSPYPQVGGATRQPTKKKTPLALIIVGLVLAVAMIGVGATLLLAGGEDEDPQAGGQTTPGETPTSTPETSVQTTPVEDPLSSDAVSERYAALAPSLSNILFPCTEVTTAVGETEHLRCDTAEGHFLDLATYESSANLERVRDFVIKLPPGTIYDLSEGRAYYSSDPGADARTKPSIYWDDSEALQSARLRGGTAKSLQSALTEIEAVAKRPTKPSDEGLRTVISENLPTLNRCKRIETVAFGQTEESLCRDEGLFIYYSHFDTRAQFLAYRNVVRGTADSHDGTVNPWQYEATPNKEEGKRIEWVDSSNDSEFAHLYWDVTTCGCAAEIIAEGDNQDRLYNWWLGQD